MVVQLRFAFAVAALLSVVACDREPAQAGDPVVLARSMVDVLAPRSNEVVGVLIDALDAGGQVDPAKLSDEEWAAMEAAVTGLGAELIALRDRPIEVVAAPGDKIFGEDTSGLSAADVQGLIEADPAGFDFYVEVMLDDTVRMRDAIAARDAAALWEVAGALDAKCNACHQRFWYPEWEEDVQTPP